MNGTVRSGYSICSRFSRPVPGRTRIIRVHEGLLFAADPEQLRDYSETYGLIVYARWRRYPDTSLWGMNA